MNNLSRGIGLSSKQSLSDCVISVIRGPCWTHPRSPDSEVNSVMRCSQAAHHLHAMSSCGPVHAAVLLLLVVQLLQVGAAEQDTGTVIPAESRWI